MSISIRIEDGEGRGTDAIVTTEGALVVTNLYDSPPVIPQKRIVFRQYLTDDGAPSGSNDMRVDGSTITQEFWIRARNDADRYLTALSFLISDQAATLGQFGTIGVLANGCRLYYETASDVVDIDDTLKTNFDFVRLAHGQPAFGNGITAFQGLNVVGTYEAYFPVLDLIRFLPPYGIKLDLGSAQRLVLEVRDDLTGVEAFNCVAYGFDRLA